MFEEFADRNAETNQAIRHVVDRWQAPSPYRSYAEYRRELSAAYAARAAFWRSVLDHRNTHAARYGGPDVVFSALLDAASGCEDRAWELAREARQAAREDQADAFRSYAANVAAVAA